LPLLFPCYEIRTGAASHSPVDSLSVVVDVATSQGGSWLLAPGSWLLLVGKIIMSPTWSFCKTSSNLRVAVSSFGLPHALSFLYSNWSCCCWILLCPREMRCGPWSIASFLKRTGVRVYRFIRNTVCFQYQQEVSFHRPIQMCCNASADVVTAIFDFLVGFLRTSTRSTSR
jgi:hypothetical protein